MALIHNQTFQITGDSPNQFAPSGIYRVIVAEPVAKKTIVVCIQEFGQPSNVRKVVSRVKKKRRLPKRAPLPLIGKLITFDTEDLTVMEREHKLSIVDLEREAEYFRELTCQKSKDEFTIRKDAMRNFLDIPFLTESILMHGGLGGLIREARARTNLSRNYLYKQWSTLCRFGISETSLKPRRFMCGAKGVPRPVDQGGRYKPGKKDAKQRVTQAATGEIIPSEQPGMSTAWRERIISADKALKLKAIKPTMRKRYELILKSNFCLKYSFKNGVFIGEKPKLGEYPNYRQVKRLLETHYNTIEKILQKTTIGHFNRSLRGLKARNWRGVSGPGHTWAIDSTVGDIYLLSSINRTWIVGRPIVYVVVDVWSTAVVGFYVCLTGPSWATAKISIFNAAANPGLIGDMWGYEPVRCLLPYPSLCYRLMCDRGGYLSKGASFTSLQLRFSLAYAAAYRPDLKGLVEVLHRIAKDKQFMFAPGTMDARRKEFELRKSNPAGSGLTVAEYVRYLHEIFTNYNLTADRSHRCDMHMAAAGVYPSPAGLWRWGHEMGIAYTRAIPQADLITQLLPSDKARVGRSSVVFRGNDYQSPVIEAEQWSTIARNHGGWDIPAHFYPGPVKRIWTPHAGHEGLLDLSISDQAKTSAEATYDEMADVIAFTQMGDPANQHLRTMEAIDSLARIEALFANSKKLTAEALSCAYGTTPSITEARLMEVANSAIAEGNSEAKVRERLRDEAGEAHAALVSQLFEVTSNE